jgi:hypothetical protein
VATEVSGGRAVGAAGCRSEMLEFAVLPVSLTCDRLRMEINPIRRQIEDLKQRTDALRGYL